MRDLFRIDFDRDATCRGDVTEIAEQAVGNVDACCRAVVREPLGFADARNGMSESITKLSW